MEFENEADYEGLDLLDELVMEDINESLEKGKVEIKNLTKKSSFTVNVNLTEKDIKVIKAGGKLNSVHSK